MERPYVICHMISSIDGKVTGDYLPRPECAKAVELYYEIKHKLKSNCFVCGRVTVEESYTEGWYPDLTKYKPVEHDQDLKMDFMLDEDLMTGFYAVAFDPKGKLGWKSNHITKKGSEYTGAQIIEVLTEQVDPRYAFSLFLIFCFANTSAMRYCPQSQSWERIY